MIATLLVALSLGAAGSADLVPTDDVWVYPHASDPSKDPFLRVWGAEGKAVAPSSADMEEFSYSYLRFDLASVPSAAKITSAQLVLTHVADPGWTLDLVKDNPVQVRPLALKVTEKGWEYEAARDTGPDKDDKAVFGSGAPTTVPEPGKTVTVTVDLLSGPGEFRKAITSALSDPKKEISVALTSALSIEVAGRTGIYKFYSKDAETAANRPVLRLGWE